MKRIIAVGRKSPAFDELIIDPNFCPHLSVVTIKPSSPSGKPWDEGEPYAQCLDCGAALDGSRRWVMPKVIDDPDGIPF